jgi:hypothetical protein
MDGRRTMINVVHMAHELDVRPVTVPVSSVQSMPGPIRRLSGQLYALTELDSRALRSPAARASGYSATLSTPLR